MSQKIVDIPGVGKVQLVKSSRSKHIRITLTPDGARVSMPTWMPYAAGTAFVAQQKGWIRRQRENIAPRRLLGDGDRIGRMHTLHFMVVRTPTMVKTRIAATKITVQIHESTDIFDETIQARALEGAKKALKKEADLVLPARLAGLADKHGFTYSGVSTKQLKRRWGSCDSKQHIVLNYFLMELPWECIDYVLLHELTHTKHLHHGPAFWALMKLVLPSVDDIRKQMRQYQPMLRQNEPLTVLPN